MPKLKFISFKGKETEIECSVGDNVMALASDNMVAGILADCGGDAICGTCHGYVDETLVSAFPQPNDNEQAMIEDGVVDPQPNSRLCCQLNVPEGLEEITIRLPKRQT